MFDFIKVYVKTTLTICAVIAVIGLAVVLGEQMLAGKVGLTIFMILCAIGFYYLLKLMWHFRDGICVVIMFIVSIFGVLLIANAIFGNKGKK